MAAYVPSIDGEVTYYNLGNSQSSSPKIIFVNGMRVLGKEHALTAGYLSLLTEHPICGVYNATAGKGIIGSAIDFAQCLPDWLQNATARPWSSAGKPAKVTEDKIQQFLQDVDKKYVVWNKATMALFKQLVLNRHTMKYIVAHSQGNLITSNALFVLEDVLGSAALQKVRVYSLASPSPAWPLSLSIANHGGGRQDNAFMNDMVALLRPHNLAKKIGIPGLQNAGDFRTLPGAGTVSLVPHDTNVIIDTLNFLKSIRGDLGLSKDFSKDFLEKCAKIAAENYPQ